MFIEDLEEKDDLNNESVNQNGVCRTTPDTPGLLTIFKKKKRLKVFVKALLSTSNMTNKVKFINTLVKYINVSLIKIYRCGRVK